MSTEGTVESELPRRAPAGFTSHTFTTPHGATLSVRVWAASPSPASPAPFVTYTHGGGWLAGNHFAPLAWMDAGFRQRGYHVVSHNYRLGPQASVDVQLQDCLDAVAWCRASLPNIVGRDKVDVNRFVVSGESGGGHLATLMAHHLSPPPRAVIDAYGIVDPAACWPIFRPITLPANPPTWTGAFGEQELHDFFADRDPANVITDALWWDEETRLPESALSEGWATEFKYTRRIRLQAELHRIRVDVTGNPEAALRSVRVGSFHEERFEDEEALKKFVRSISPGPLLEGKTWYPPTAFLHGTEDLAAPIEQSRVMAAKLREMGVEVLESYEEGEEHVFDQKYTVSYFLIKSERVRECYDS